jgi:hypothetical protein
MIIEADERVAQIKEMDTELDYIDASQVDVARDDQRRCLSLEMIYEEGGPIVIRFDPALFRKIVAAFAELYPVEPSPSERRMLANAMSSALSHKYGVFTDQDTSTDLVNTVIDELQSLGYAITKKV